MKLAAFAVLFSVAAASLAATPAPGWSIPGADPKVRPQDDLYDAVNGGWIQDTQIPADKSTAYGVELNDVTDRRVREIVEQLAGTIQAKGSVAQKVADFYASYLDTDAIDHAGLAPMQALLAQIDAIKTVSDLARWQGQAQGRLDLPVSMRWVMPDFKDPTVYRAMTWQGGLGLPDRDYYLKPDDAQMAKALAAYQRYLTRLAELGGDRHPLLSAKRVIALERRIAAAHWPASDTRDPATMYNPMTPAALATLAPGFDWVAFLKAAGLADQTSLTMTQPSAITAIAALYQEFSLADWKLYVRLHSLDEAAPVLPKAFREARFAFRGTALSGATAEEPRWQQGIAQVNNALGEAIGQLYVARYFPPEHKARMQKLVANLLAAYRDSITQLTWMSEATKAQALIKLSKYDTKIGYPDVWRDYNDLDVRAGDALGNQHRAKRFEWAHQAAKAGHSVDRRDWEMTPQTVNAYYNPLRNEIVFPAAILQPPMFDMAADDASNYGAIGATIGHEISHGFDGQGSQFDGDGTMRNWWSAADSQAFAALSAKLVAQYDGYEALPGRQVDGTLTLPENLADLAGLQIAYRAWQHSLGGKAAPTIGGLSGAQRFFIAYAQSWRAKVRDEQLLQSLTTDPHAPQRFRTNGPLVNTDGFHQAFATQEGDLMYKAASERIQIW